MSWWRVNGRVFYYFPATAPEDLLVDRDNTRSLGDPKRKVWCSAAAVFPWNMTKVYRTRRTRRFFRRLSAAQLTWNLHTTQANYFAPNETERLSISPACWKQRIKRIVWKTVMSAESNREQMIAVGGFISMRKWTGVHSSLVVSLHKR
jgi:hypothetical protein